MVVKFRATSPMRGSRNPKTITNSSGCIVVRIKKYGSSRRATVTSRRRIAKNTFAGDTESLMPASFPSAK